MTAEPPEIEVLRVRLAAVERRIAGLRRAGGVVGLVAVLAGGIVYHERSLASTSGILEGRQIELRDEAGKVRASVGIRPDGSVALMMNDGDAIPRIVLGVGGGPAGTPGLALSDNQGRLRAALAVAVDGAASVGFLDQAEMIRTTLGTSGNGLPALNLVDDARRVRVALQADGDGTSLLRLFDRAGQPRVALGLNGDVPSLTMRDEDGALLGRLPDR